MKSNVEAFNERYDMVWNVVISKNLVNQIVMNFSKCISGCLVQGSISER